MTKTEIQAQLFLHTIPDKKTKQSSHIFKRTWRVVMQQKRTAEKLRSYGAVSDMALVSGAKTPQIMALVATACRR